MDALARVFGTHAAPGRVFERPWRPNGRATGVGDPLLAPICAFQFGPRRGYNVAQEQSPAGRGPTATFPLLKSHV